MKRRILIVSGIQLSTNPRVFKEATALADAGYDVEVVGDTLNPELSTRDRAIFESQRWKYTVLADAAARTLKGRIQWQALRTRRRVWRAGSRLGIESPRQIGYTAPEILQYALSKSADLTIVHNPVGVWAGTQLARRGHRIAVDMEDWYSEDVTPEGARTYPVKSLRVWEKNALHAAAYSTTTSECMAVALAHDYGCQRPLVVYNAFSIRERDSIDGIIRDRVDRDIPSLCWFSQITGAGRGLELLMDSLQYCDRPFEIHLRGKVTHSYAKELRQRAPESWRGRIFFHPQVSHAELISRIAEHDVGLASEMRLPRSRDLTITNKLPFYLLAGLAVVASDTAGQCEAAEKARGAVFPFSVGNAEELASTLNTLFSDANRIARARKMAIEAAADAFSWERSKQVLLDAVARVLE